MTTLSNSLDRRLAQAVATTGRWNASGQRRQVFSWLTGPIDFLARGVFWAWRNRKYITPLKLANMAVVNIEFLFKRERLVGRPYKMKIESTNICNTRCQLCPTGLGLRGRRKGRMAYEQYTALITQVKHHLFALDLSMWGDPLVAPDIYKMIGHAHDSGIWTYISSNLHGFKIEHRKQRDGSLEDIDDATKLIESGLDMLTCSLHGASQETFAIYQPGKDFGDALAKVKHIVATKKKLGSSTPAIQLNFVVTKHNEHEIEPFRAMAEELGCKPIFSTASMNVRFLNKDKKLTPLGLADDVLAKKTKDHLDNWLPENKDYVLDSYNEMQETGTLRSDEYNGKKSYNCSWPWRQSVVNWDGSVATCCGSFEEREDIASVIEQPFSKVWNSEKYRLARRSFKKKLSEPQVEDNPCATCPGFML